MIQSKTVEHLDKSNVKLSVSIAKEKSAKAYQDLLNEYSKKAQIKGFRPGKVPTSVLETKYGEGLKMEAAQNLVEESLKVLFDEIEEKPLPYSQPRLDEDFKFVPGEEFTYAVTYDVYPKIAIGDYKGLTVEEDTVTVEKSDIEHELEHIRDQNAIVAENEGPVAAGDTVTVDMIERDTDGKDITDSKREDFTFTLGQHGNIYHIDDELIGAKKGAETIVEKTYEKDFHHEELAGKSLKIAITVKRIRRKELPALDDELAQDVDEKFKTLDDLKKDIKSRLEKSADSRLRQRKVQSIIDQILAKQDFVLPESMVSAELYSKYENMIRQFGGRESTLLQLLKAQGSSPDALLEDWRPNTEKDLKASIVVRELIKLEKIEATDADVEAELARQAEGSRMSLEETRDYFAKNNMMDYLKDNFKERTLFDKLLASAATKKGAKVKYVDLMSENS